MATAADDVLSQAWREDVVPQLVEGDNEQWAAANDEHGEDDRDQATDDH